MHIFRGVNHYQCWLHFYFYFLKFHSKYINDELSRSKLLNASTFQWIHCWMTVCSSPWFSLAIRDDYILSVWNGPLNCKYLFFIRIASNIRFESESVIIQNQLIFNILGSCISETVFILSKLLCLNWSQWSAGCSLCAL